MQQHSHHPNMAEMETKEGKKGSKLNQHANSGGNNMEEIIYRMSVVISDENGKPE